MYLQNVDRFAEERLALRPILLQRLRVYPKVKWLFYLCYHGSFAADLFQSSVTNVDNAIVVYFGLT